MRRVLLVARRVRHDDQRPADQRKLFDAQFAKVRLGRSPRVEATRAYLPNCDIHGHDPLRPFNVETSQADWVLTLGCIIPPGGGRFCATSSRNVRNVVFCTLRKKTKERAARLYSSFLVFFIVVVERVRNVRNEFRDVKAPVCLVCMFALAL
jgi:hypothetical protein